MIFLSVTLFTHPLFHSLAFVVAFSNFRSKPKESQIQALSSFGRYITEEYLPRKLGKEIGYNSKSSIAVPKVVRSSSLYDRYLDS
jgi:hypothetical protein